MNKAPGECSRPPGLHTPANTGQMRVLGMLLIALFLAACGGSEPVIKTQVHLVQGSGFETLLEGTANLDGGRIEQAIKARPFPIDLQVVVTREGEGEEFSQKTLTFHLQERGDQFVLAYDSPSGESQPTTAPVANGREQFVHDACEKIAAIANSERKAMATGSEP